MNRTHEYEVSVRWTGDRGSGTSGFREYDRDHLVAAPGRPPIAGSSDPAFRGAHDRWNPEQLLVAALSQCHMLWFLHLAAEAGVVVRGYEDVPRGAMEEAPDGGGRFTEVVLRPRVTLADPARAEETARLHREAHEKCFIAQSVAFPVRHEPAPVSATGREKART